MRERLSLDWPQLLEKTSVQESVYESPFNFEKQSLLVAPTDMPDPSHPDYVRKVTEMIWHAVQASHGNAFILFTSYGMLRMCYQVLQEHLQRARMPVLKQGDDNRHALLKKFRETDRSVLFGTDSFWEGIDVAGDALRLVVITKLPFRVPSEPMTEARHEAIAKKGGDPFMDYAVPNAIVKFKQGFGRLIRHQNDRGCILCLDSRLLKKGYGKFFVNSLPKSKQFFGKSDEIAQQMRDFYKETAWMIRQR